MSLSLAVADSSHALAVGKCSRSSPLRALATPIPWQAQLERVQEAEALLALVQEGANGQSQVELSQVEESQVEGLQTGLQVGLEEYEEQGLEEGAALLARMQAARAAALETVERRASAFFRAAILRASAEGERGVDQRELARVAWEQAAADDAALRTVCASRMEPTRPRADWWIGTIRNLSCVAVCREALALRLCPSPVRFGRCERPLPLMMAVGRGLPAAHGGDQGAEGGGGGGGDCERCAGGGTAAYYHD